MSETLYQRMNPVAVFVGSSVRRLLRFQRAGKQMDPQPYVVDSLSICSMIKAHYHGDDLEMATRHNLQASLRLLIVFTRLFAR